jgi:hypothetical protein
MHTPISPVNFACAVAARLASSSCALYELDLVLRPAQRTEHGIHAIARKPVNAFDSAIDQSGDERVAHGKLLGHCILENCILEKRLAVSEQELFRISESGLTACRQQHQQSAT